MRVAGVSRQFQIRVRSFAAVHPGGVSDEFHMPDSIVARDILFKHKMSYIRERLAADTRFRMPIEEWNSLIEANDVPKAQAEEFLKACHTAGIVLYYPHRAPFIYLRPRAVTRELLRLLDPEGSIAAALMETKTADLEKLEAEFAMLTEKKNALDAVAAKKGSLWVKIAMVSVGVQAAIMTRLIWWDLSWDVMEPIAYLLSFSYLTLGWGWFLISKEDVAEYGSIAGKYISSTKQRLYAKNGFSLQAYTKMAEEIENRKITLKSFGVVREKDRKYSYPLPVNKIIEKSPEAPTPNLAAQKA